MVKLAEENKKSERLITYYYTEKKVKGMKVLSGIEKKIISLWKTRYDENTHSARSGNKSQIPDL